MNPDSPHLRPGQGIVRALQRSRTSLLTEVRRLALEPDEHFPVIFAAMVCKVEAAFRHEECLMEVARYGGLHAQRRDNALLLGALHHACSRVDRGDLGTGREVVAALPGLLSLHRFVALRVLNTCRRPPGRFVHKLRVRAMLAPDPEAGGPR